MNLTKLVRAYLKDAFADIYDKHEAEAFKMKPLKTYEAAKKLDCTQRTIRRLLDQGKLHGYKIGGTWRIESDENFEKRYTKTDKSDISR